MPDKNETALLVAEFLLQSKAIKLQPSKPFTWASGWKSPIYCDNRVTLSYPPIRTFIRQQLTHLINEEFGAIDLVAGVATGGIPQGVLVAQDLGIPFVYVRSEPKKHGRRNLIEGHLSSGQRVVVVEDLISTGKSSIQAVKALREAECDVAGMVAVFSYGFDVAQENLKEANCKYFTLTNYEALLKKAVEDGYIREEEAESLKEWRKNPESWGQ
ncbi:MAG: orotate phosphoribosyltransferase [Solitalea sp.]